METINPIGLPDKVLTSLRKELKRGQQIKMLHPGCDKGTKKSTPAMSIHRGKNGLTWFCHRCKQHGYSPDSNLSPNGTSERLKQMRDQPREMEITDLTLPYDFECIYPVDYPRIPWVAYRWLWNNFITDDDMRTWNIGWSDLYGRVILPIKSKTGRLNGWVGRNTDEEKNSEMSKYIIRKRDGYGRLYFCTTANNILGNVVVVEDILSAIRVHNSVRCPVTTIALLTTSMDKTLMKILQDKRVVLWLDHDARFKSISLSSKLNSLGVKTSHISTYKDPKKHNSFFINQEIHSKLRSMA